MDSVILSEYYFDINFKQSDIYYFGKMLCLLMKTCYTPLRQLSIVFKTQLKIDNVLLSCFSVSLSIQGVSQVKKSNPLCFLKYECPHSLWPLIFQKYWVFHGFTIT